MENYEKMVMEQAYRILNEDDFKWSSEFKGYMRIELVSLLMEYFKDIEDYRKCSKLKTILENLESSDDEHNSKGIETGSKKS
jgi:hypothetical protein